MKAISNNLGQKTIFVPNLTNSNHSLNQGFDYVGGLEGNPNWIYIKRGMNDV